MAGSGSDSLFLLGIACTRGYVACTRGYVEGTISTFMTLWRSNPKVSHPIKKSDTFLKHRKSFCCNLWVVFLITALLCTISTIQRPFLIMDYPLHVYVWSGQLCLLCNSTSAMSKSYLFECFCGLKLHFAFQHSKTQNKLGDFASLEIWRLEIWISIQIISIISFFQENPCNAGFNSF